MSDMQLETGTRVRLTRPVAGLLAGAVGTVQHTPIGPHCDVVVRVDELAALDPGFAAICCYWNEIEPISQEETT